VVLDGTKTLLCQLCVKIVCLLQPKIILGKTGACKNGTGNNDTNGKVGKNGTLMLNFFKLKPQTPTPKYKPKILTSNPSLKL